MVVLEDPSTAEVLNNTDCAARMHRNPMAFHLRWAKGTYTGSLVWPTLPVLGIGTSEDTRECNIVPRYNNRGDRNDYNYDSGIMQHIDIHVA